MKSFAEINNAIVASKAALGVISDHDTKVEKCLSKIAAFIVEAHALAMRKADMVMGDFVNNKLGQLVAEGAKVEVHGGSGPGNDRTITIDLPEYDLSVDLDTEVAISIFMRIGVPDDSHLVAKIDKNNFEYLTSNICFCTIPKDMLVDRISTLTGMNFVEEGDFNITIDTPIYNFRIKA